MTKVSSNTFQCISSHTSSNTTWKWWQDLINTLHVEHHTCTELNTTEQSSVKNESSCHKSGGTFKWHGAWQEARFVLCNGSYAMASLWWTQLDPAAVTCQASDQYSVWWTFLSLSSACQGTQACMLSTPCTPCVVSMVQFLTFWAMLKVNLF